MAATDLPTDVAPAWEELARYRKRYAIEDRIGPIRDLERSIDRRMVRLATARHRAAELEANLEHARREVAEVEEEVAASHRMGALLIEDVLDRVRLDFGEAWSPSPVRGVRAWEIRGDELHGVREHWDGPVMEARCLNRPYDSEDVPHTGGRCGPPACGVYAVKSASAFLAGTPGVADGIAIGVVAMTGKVVEHADGYRAARARVVAVVAHRGTQVVMTEEPDEIRLLFTGVGPAMRLHGRPATVPGAEIESFLERALTDQEESWT